MLSELSHDHIIKRSNKKKGVQKGVQKRVQKRVQKEEQYDIKISDYVIIITIKEINILEEKYNE